MYIIANNLYYVAKKSLRITLFLVVFQQWWLFLNQINLFFIMQSLLDNNLLKVQGNWNIIWKLKVSNKVWVFLWRGTRGLFANSPAALMKGSSVSPLSLFLWQGLREWIALVCGVSSCCYDVVEPLVEAEQQNLGRHWS